ncbi:MAG: serine/threonine protein kinase [Alphaproteobacteria bacterium]|nr:serine/threonine protein kinase [Alphaproteobacteria bacterium]MDE2336063.1 serine/threonine protein kinase [Alphaproteobacteria bacterium]
MTAHAKTVLPGTAVAVGGADFPASAVLLRGFSGRGKSDLAFRLIGAGATLICDDQVALERRQDDKIIAEPVESIRGLLEVRGLGLLKYPVAPPTQLRLAVDLVSREDVPRLPDPETVDILGVPVAVLKLHAFDASAPAKIIRAIELVHRPDLLV